VGPFPESRTGHTYLLTAIDIFDSWGDAIPLRSTESAVLIDALQKHVICHQGVPVALLKDNSPNISGALMTEWQELLDICAKQSTPYHPEGNSQCERYNGTLLQLVRAYAIDHEEAWDECLPELVFAYNTSVHSTTGYSPFYLRHGRDARMPGASDLQRPSDVSPSLAVYLENLRDALTIAHTTAAERSSHASLLARQEYEKSHRAPDYQVGDLVFVRFPKPPPENPRNCIYPGEDPMLLSVLCHPAPFKYRNLGVHFGTPLLM
jgi:hypothetical protein